MYTQIAPCVKGRGRTEHRIERFWFLFVYIVLKSFFSLVGIVDTGRVNRQPHRHRSEIGICVHVLCK